MTGAQVLTWPLEALGLVWLPVFFLRDNLLRVGFWLEVWLGDTDE